MNKRRILQLVLSPVPGPGEIIGGNRQKGVLMFVSFVSLTVVTLWRISELGRLAGSGWPVFISAVSQSPFFVVSALFALTAAWVLSVRDVWKPRRVSGVFFMILTGFFIQGWQIAEIDPVQLIRRAPKAAGPLSRILWPWDAAVTYDEQYLSARALIRTEGQNAPEHSVPEPGIPWLRSDPNTGRMSAQDTNYNSIPGTRITLSGGNFEPHTETEIWWQDAMGSAYRPRESGEYLSAVTDSEGSFSIQMTMPYQMPGSRDTEFTAEARQVFRTGGPRPSEALRLTLSRMTETVFMGMMATVFGIILALPLSFLAARNIMSSSKLTRLIYYITRSVLSIIRSVEPVIWAVIAVVWVGLGPFAGIVALTLHSAAGLAKLFSEAIEEIDPNPAQAIEAVGASRIQVILFGVLPLLTGPFVAFSVYRWDINVRMSTVIGLVGGGGIGFLLVQYIRILDYRSAGIAVWLIAVTVGILDYISAGIRKRYS